MVPSIAPSKKISSKALIIPVLSLLFGPFHLLASNTESNSQDKKTIPIEERWKSPLNSEMEKMTDVAFIPFPKKVTLSKDQFLSIPKNTALPVIHIGPSRIEENSKPTLELSRIQSYLSKTIYNKADALLGLKKTFPSASLKNKVAEESASLPKVVFILQETTPDQDPESYTLTIDDQSITIKGASPSALFYGTQTLFQLAEAHFNNKTQTYKLPHTSIEDRPDFFIRGFMHDVGRNFLPVEELKKQISNYARYKINVFHWHLTDNPAWRIESKVYPKLNQASYHRKGRDEGKYYTFDDIRDIIAYAAARGIMIIPELDMPGHSAFFKPTFGFEMGTPEGMDVLEKLIEEFCAEIPQSSCPIIHLGTDEVRIKDPDVFVKRMTDKVKSLGRIPMQWKPGLKVGDGAIGQLWREYGAGGPTAAEEKTPYIESGMGYINIFEQPYQLIQRYFFKQITHKKHHDALALGGIACLWPDVRVEDKRNIERHNPQWPGLITFSERIWNGIDTDGSAWSATLPPKGSEAREAFERFEKRLTWHKRYHQHAFPYWPHSQLSWDITEPVSSHDSSALAATRDKVLKQDASLPLTTVDGGALTLRSRSAQEGVLPKSKPGVTVWATMTLYSPKDQTIPILIGFDTPARSNRRATGIPLTGNWSVPGTKVWLNGKEIPAPQWKEPGTRIYPNPTWHQPANEISFIDEEFWWTYPKTMVQLKKGKNTLIVELPYIGAHQHWGVTALPFAEPLPPLKE